MRSVKSLYGFTICEADSHESAAGGRSWCLYPEYRTKYMPGEEIVSFATLEEAERAVDDIIRGKLRLYAKLDPTAAEMREASRAGTGSSSNGAGAELPVPFHRHGAADT
jgi:hypothetical protein